MNTILLATDGSMYSEHATEMAKTYLKAWPEARLVVLYVTAKDHYAYDFIPDVVDEAEKEITERIKTTTEEQFAGFQNNVHFLHKSGHPSKTICDVAKDQDVDLIILGSHGRGIIDRALLGSVAHGVLQRAERPVLVVKK
ncbi:universal stress protein [Virgibacillus halodenitrificans]|jgi:nucleotide-binding universal stress UspA family protein|uniref:Universal stress protein n=1 Tax=Virgibacillus halodenitrificans TaxID=1482 RepID=A0ABR7VM54_VIRHA|nr:universal stress protein [Virgibacillus halodenitrificans]MBD1223000.1 universal stress protein [Virgibacillus halodenitrificans]